MEPDVDGQPDATPEVSLIVVNLDGRDHLEPLLASLEAQTIPSSRFELIVVDNASQDDSVAFLRARWPGVRIIQNSGNEGFARPNNVAAKAARGRYLALVNNDMRLAPDWLTRMADALDGAPPDVACAGSRILSWDGTHIDFVGGSANYFGMGYQDFAFEPASKVPLEACPRELLFACGGAVLVRRDVFLEVGGYDESYFAYLEDVDLGWRLWVLGYRVIFCPEALAYHRHNATSARFDVSWKLALIERNALFTAYKNWGDETLARVFPAAVLLTVKRAATRGGFQRKVNLQTTPKMADTRSTPISIPPNRRGPIARARSLYARLGFWRGTRTVLLKVIQRVLTRLGAPSSLAEPVAAIKLEGYAGIQAIESFIDHFPAIMDRRRVIQGNRRRRDSEIVHLLKTPFLSAVGDPDYLRAQDLLVKALGIDTLFNPEHEQAVVPDSARNLD